MYVCVHPFVTVSISLYSLAFAVRKAILGEDAKSEIELKVLFGASAHLMHECITA